MENQTQHVETLPLLPLRGMMVFPHMVLHFDVGRKKSMTALEKAMLEDQRIFLVAQRDADVDEPEMEDLYDVGTIARVKQILKLPNDNIRVLVEGDSRGILRELIDTEPCLRATVEVAVPEDEGQNEVKIQALVRTALQAFHDLSKFAGKVSSETVGSVEQIDDASQLADVIAANVLTKLEERQHILGLFQTEDRLEQLCQILMREVELASIEKKVQARVKKQIDKNQKDYYLREQIKAIQTELGDREMNDVEDLRERLEQTPVNEEAREKASRELDRISRMTPGTPEIGVSRTYVEWILDLPWGKRTKDNLNLTRAKKILDEDHYGMESVKDRIIEYLAVRQIKNDMKGPILCFVGPPGVGKTSIARSIARSVGRKFVQMSLGGVRDEAEIRGHRRTYVGAIPGRIISSMKQGGTENPVFLFDEIDKMSSDFRGDPASAMLEVLDSEQNHNFRDHYMELPYDLSRVMFLTTANTTETIPRPLLDRMEVIELSGYTEQEKLYIAKQHLLPKQIEEHGLKKRAVRMSDKVLLAMINEYTREAGVRTLERQIAKVVRKSAVRMLETGEAFETITPALLKSDLGTPRFRYEQAGKKPEIGVVNGLAYTVFGGDTLQVETSVTPGKGALELTGHLGEVMKESAHAARTWVRAHAVELGIDPSFYEKQDIHIHVPEGAVPKDGPSAGITLTTALVSALTGIPVKQSIAMTGEITLRGRILPIGGLKEKLLAAHRAGIKTVLIPQENVRDLDDVPEIIREKLEIIPVERMDQVLKLALEK